MKERDIMDTLEADFEVDFSDEEGFSVRRKNKENRSAGKPSGKSGLSLLIGVVIFGLVVLIVLFQRSSNIDSGSKMRSLERRIKQLEERLYRLDRIEANLEQIEEKNKQFTTFIDTFHRLETPSKRSIAQTSEKQKRLFTTKCLPVKRFMP